MAIPPDLETMNCIEMAIFDATLLTATYQGLNLAANQPGTMSIGFQYDVKILKIYNDSTSGVTLSYDSVINHDYIPSKGTLILDLQTNHKDWGSSGTGSLVGRMGQIIFGKGTPATGGPGLLNIYISGYR